MAFAHCVCGIKPPLLSSQLPASNTTWSLCGDLPPPILPFSPVLLVFPPQCHSAPKQFSAIILDLFLSLLATLSQRPPTYNQSSKITLVNNVELRYQTHIGLKLKLGQSCRLTLIFFEKCSSRNNSETVYMGPNKFG